jgi:hypothetical protein
MAKHVHFFLELRNRLKLYHWQTQIYSRHTAVDRILGDLDSKIDEFVEIWSAKYGRPRMTAATRMLNINNLTDKQAVSCVKDAIEYLVGPLTATLSVKKDSDLANIRDEMIGSLNQLLYLFTLRG